MDSADPRQKESHEYMWMILAVEARFNAAELCRNLDISASTLNRRIMNAFGQTAHGWLSDLRRKSGACLLAENHQIKGVAYLLGYRRPDHFASHFREWYGVVPSKFSWNDGLGISAEERRRLASLF